MKVNEKKFYNSLENIFTGAEIEGDSGFVNLLKIKSQYYKLILEQFKSEVDSEAIITDSFKEEFFDKLYSFFEKYFSESGSVYFVKTANWQRVYEQVYTDNKDIVLFWKTHMLYYVKSDILFQSLDVTITDEESKQDYHFYFDVGNLQAKQNNEKKQIVFTFREIIEEKNNVDTLNGKQGIRVYIFDVAYSERGKKTNIDDIIKKTQIPQEIIEKAFRTFKKQSEVDFFINKNAKKFLTEQLDLYLHQILLEEENKFEQNRLDQIKTIKTFALKIIDFISQFEDELVRVWNKPKFVRNSNYVITIDKLSDEQIKKISKHKNLKEQINEWQELGMVDDKFDFQKRSNKEKYLPIDTKYFKDLEIEILSLFDNLDEALDGRLIHSENYQALNTLSEKYKGKVQCIYIDPPFNTGNDFPYIDNFQSSSWLSLMNDRIKIASTFLNNNGSFYLHLDRNANYLGRFIMDKIFSEYRNEIVWKYFVSGKYPNEFAKDHDLIMVYANNKKNLFNYTKEKDEVLYEKKKNLGDIIISEDGLEYYKYNGELRTFEKQITETWSINKIKRDGNEILGFDTQKPEELLRRIIQAASTVGTYVFDFFAGSATTLSVAHKLQRKWIGVEMGIHFGITENGYSNYYWDTKKEIFKISNIGRMKMVVFGKISGISKKLQEQHNLNIGGFFKYCSIEQYEDTLRNIKYKNNSPNSIFDTKKPFAQYVFYADEKFAHVLNVHKEKLDLDFDILYQNIDFAETISNLLGLPIKKITKSSVILQEGEIEREIKIDYKNMNNDEKLEFLRLLKPLLWWGE